MNPVESTPIVEYAKILCQLIDDNFRRKEYTENRLREIDEIWLRLTEAESEALLLISRKTSKLREELEVKYGSPLL